MNDTDKLARLKVLLNPDGNAVLPSDSVLGVYLLTARDEILAWLYNGNTPESITDVPARYEMIQLQAVIVGYSVSGNEGQSAGNENGISRTWKYSDMVDFIHRHITPFAEVV